MKKYFITFKKPASLKMPINTSNFLILNKRKIMIQGPDFFFTTFSQISR